MAGAGGGVSPLVSRRARLRAGADATGAGGADDLGGEPDWAARHQGRIEGATDPLCGAARGADEAGERGGGDAGERTHAEDRLWAGGREVGGDWADDRGGAVWGG